VNYALLVLIFVISVGVSYLLTPLMEKTAIKTGILSIPEERNVHTQPIPYLGGLAVYFAFVVSTLVVFLASQQLRMESFDKITGLLIGGTLIVILGLWDDIKNIKPIIKLSGQIGVALMLYGFGFRIELLTNPLLGGEMRLPLFLNIIFTVAWIIGLVNAMNLIDGLDGLAAGIAAIVGVTLTIIALHLNNYTSVFVLAALAGSSLGFLRFNFHPARIFLGDTGSMFLGLILASATLTGYQHKSATAVVLLIPITALAIPIYDTFLAVIRRIFKTGSIFKADKRHLHHRLLSTSLKQSQIVLFIYLITIYLGIFAFLFVLIPDKYALILLILLALLLFIMERAVVFIEKEIRLRGKLEPDKRKQE